MCDNARNNLNTEPIAETLLDEVPPAVLDEWLEKPDAEFMQLLAQFHPDVNNFRNWFIKLRADMIRLTTESEDDTSAANTKPQG